MSDEAQDKGIIAASTQARLTPYELVFTERFDAEVFPKIAAEASRH